MTLANSTSVANVGHLIVREYTEVLFPVLLVSEQSDLYTDVKHLVKIFIWWVGLFFTPYVVGLAKYCRLLRVELFSFALFSLPLYKVPHAETD